MIEQHRSSKTAQLLFGVRRKRARQPRSLDAVCDRKPANPLARVDDVVGVEEMHVWLVVWLCARGAITYLTGRRAEPRAK